MKIPLGRDASIQFDFNGLMWAGIVVAGVGVAGWIASFLGAFPPESRFADLPLGVTILGATLYAVGRIVQMVGHIRRSR